MLVQSRSFTESMQGQLICKAKQSTYTLAMGWQKIDGVGEKITASVVCRLITSVAAPLYTHNHLLAIPLSHSNEC